MQKKRERKKKRNRAAPTPVVSGWEKKGKTKWMMNESGRERERGMEEKRTLPKEQERIPRKNLVHLCRIHKNPVTLGTTQ